MPTPSQYDNLQNLVMALMQRNAAPADVAAQLQAALQALPAGSGATVQPVDVQIFDDPSISYTWVKPANARWVVAVVIGAGGGGGSGGSAAAGVQCSGGGGGQGGGRSIWEGPAEACGSTEAVVVGQGGNNGAPVILSDTVGNPGLAGGSSAFGVICQAEGGDFGRGGATNGATAVGGTAKGRGTEVGGAGGDGKGTTGLQGTDSAGAYSPRGGGGGGGIFTTDATAAGGAGGGFLFPQPLAGGIGGAPGGGVNGGDGADGQHNVGFNGVLNPTIGASGPGGGASGSASGGSGGNAGSAKAIPGAGGAGGGAVRNTGTSGQGTKGGNGMVVVAAFP